jgi:hypothetical protein
VRVALELKGGSSINAEALFERLDFECFLEYVDAYEKKRPIGRVDGKCQVAASHFEFLSSVRKMFQPAPGSSLTSLFDEFLHRNRKLCPLADVNSAQGKYLRSFENLQIGGDVVDIGHVLVGIEASRRQHPDPVFPSAVARDAHTESLMTWGGDLASALEAYAEAVFVDHKRANLQDYLNHLAGRADLLGDLDGLNLGAVYDESKTFAENLRKYYGVRPFRRFHDFLSSALDDSAKPLFKLIRQSPPVLDSAGRLEIASVVTYFCGGAVYKRRQAGKLNDAQSNQILAMCNRGTKEMDAVIDYFFKILLDGLAKEP